MKKITDKFELRDYILNDGDISQVDYYDITDMSWMFEGCKNLAKIPKLDTGNVTDMSWMFEGCEKLVLSKYWEDVLRRNYE